MRTTKHGVRVFEPGEARPITTKPPFPCDFCKDRATFFVGNEPISTCDAHRDPEIKRQTTPAPFYGIHEHESTLQALERLGFYVSDPYTHQHQTRSVARVSDGWVMIRFRTVDETNSWIEAKCPDLRGLRWFELCP